MKSIAWFILLFLILGLAVFGYFQAVPEAKDQAENLPKIEITPQFFDFGEVDYGKVAEHSFLVENTGSGILEIKRVATSCACTSAEVALDKIEPGQSTQLLVSYDTGAMSGPHGKGQQERIIYVKSTDPVNPQVEVKIKAYVR